MKLMKQHYKPEEDDWTSENGCKVERRMGITFRRGTFAKVAYDTEIVSCHLERIGSSDSWQHHHHFQNLSSLAAAITHST